MPKPFISVIIPVYNNARTLPFTLIDAYHHLTKDGWPYEILVIDDGSTDATAEVARRFSPLIANIKLIKNLKRVGAGAAVRQGLLAAKGKWLLVVDGSHSATIDEFHKMLRYLNSGFDIVIGSRVVPYSQPLNTLHIGARLVRILHNLFVRIILLYGVGDTQSGMFAISSAAAANVATLGKINTAGGIPELFALARRKGYKIKEVPIAWHERGSEFSRYIDSLAGAIKVRWGFFKRQYKISA